MKKLTVLLFLCSCAHMDLSDNAKLVKIFRRGDAPMSCQQMNRVNVSSLQAITDDGKENYLRKEAEKSGGNAVEILSTGQGDFNLWRAQIYKCDSIASR